MKMPVRILLTLGLLLTACSNNTGAHYSCSDEGCFSCTDQSCHMVSVAPRESCDCTHPCLPGFVCGDSLGCVSGCSDTSECEHGTTCVRGLCLGFVAPGVREVYSRYFCEHHFLIID